MLKVLLLFHCIYLRLEMSEAHTLFSVQLEPLALVCYHCILFGIKNVMKLYNCLQFDI